MVVRLLSSMLALFTACCHCWCSLILHISILMHLSPMKEILFPSPSSKSDDISLASFRYMHFLKQSLCPEAWNVWIGSCAHSVSHESVCVCVGVRGGGEGLCGQHHQNNQIRLISTCYQQKMVRWMPNREDVCNPSANTIQKGAVTGTFKLIHLTHRLGPTVNAGKCPQVCLFI